MNFNSLRKEISSNNLSVKELVNDIFAKIDQKDPEINSYICITKDNAIEQAELMIKESKMSQEELIFLKRKISDSRQDLEILYLMKIQ